MKKINGTRQYDRVDDIYKYISTTQDGVIFARHNAVAFRSLLNAYRASKSQHWAIYGDCGGIDKDGKIYISGRDMLVSSKGFIDVSKVIRLEYGRCPKCGEPCQPDYGEDENTEYVSCCDCRISWTLYHDDPTGPRDNSQPWRKYRIGEIESFDDMLVEPYECREHKQ